MAYRAHGTPQQQRAIETRDALLQGAARIFSKLPYAEARLKDIAKESGISEGSLYFHFGNKDDIALALFAAQQERMTSVLTQALARPGQGRQKALDTIKGLAELIATDVVVQAGIKLSTQPISALRETATRPYFEWIHIAQAVLSQGVEDGSIDPDINVSEAAEYVNSLFVGAQVLSELADSWTSLPERMRQLEPYIVRAIRPAAEKSSK